MLMRSLGSSLPRNLEAWIERYAINPRVVAEFEDRALMKAFGEHGADILTSPSAVEQTGQSHMDAAVQSAPAEHPVHYERHRPEHTLLYQLYQLVKEYYPAFKAHLEAQSTDLPRYVERELEDYLKFGRLEHGFLRVRCDTCHEKRLVAFSCCLQGPCFLPPVAGRGAWPKARLC